MDIEKLSKAVIVSNIRIDSGEYCYEDEIIVGQYELNKSLTQRIAELEAERETFRAAVDIAKFQCRLAIIDEVDFHDAISNIYCAVQKLDTEPPAITTNSKGE